VEEKGVEEANQTKKIMVLNPNQIICHLQLTGLETEPLIL
jgi:hypothetical protein